MDRLRFATATVIVGVWAVSYTESLVNHNYSPPPGLDGLMLVVAGYLFAKGFKRKDGDG